MKSFFIYLFVLVNLFSCKQENDSNMPHINQDTASIKEEDIQVPITKYIIVVLYTEEKEYVNDFREYVESGSIVYELASAKNQDYMSDILTINQFTEDAKYISADLFSNKIKNALKQLDNEYNSKNWYPSYRKKESSVIRREILVFDSYAEASVYKEKIL